MAAIAAVLDAGDPAGRGAAVRRMLDACRRGDAVPVLVRAGAATLGLVGDRAASIASQGEWAAVVSGELDDPVPGAPAGATSAEQLLHLFGGRAATPDLARLRGSYSAVVTDGARLWAWRDHIGSLPLFYRFAGGQTAVGSEAKQVVVGAGIERRPDAEVVEAIFWSEYDDDTPAALCGVRRLPKSFVLEATEGAARARRYYDPAPLLETSRLTNPADLQEAFDRLMTQAVGRCLRPDAVVSLSGGVDSTAVAAYGADQQQERFGAPLHALSTVYPDHPSVDESEWIELVAGRFGMPLTTFVPGAPHLGGLSELARLLDGPVPTVWFSEINEFYRHATEIGRRTILSGECAEFVIEMRDGLVPYLVKNGRWRGAGRFLSAQRRGGASTASVLRSVAIAAAPDAVLRTWRARPGRPDPSPPPDWMDHGRASATSDEARAGSRQRWRMAQLRAFHGPGLSFEADAVVQDVHGVTLRRPWLDVDLWEFFLGLRAEVKFPGSRYKALVKQLLRGRLPDELLDRRTFTSFDESISARMDYDGLTATLVDPSWRMPGVDYARLAEHLRRRDLGLREYIWARNLAMAHAFVEAG